MRLPCESIVTAVLPALRSLIARELIEYHSLSQVEAARRLGTTQSAISHYLNGKRGDQLADRLQSVPEVTSTILDLGANMAKETPSHSQVMSTICQLCETLRREGVTCALHRNTTELPDDCGMCKA
jgi:predicted transcriptional regulator